MESDHHPPSGSNHPVPQSDVAQQNKAIRFQLLLNGYIARCPIPSSLTMERRACFRPWLCAHYKATKSLGAVPWVPICVGRYGRKTHVPWHAIFLRPDAHPQRPHQTRVYQAPASALRSSTYPYAMRHDQRD